jgi:hypothetical protein
MEQILNHVNQALTVYNIALDDMEVSKEFNDVCKDWNDVVKTTIKPINFLIIGEATTCSANYFYKLKANTTSFLDPSHFNKDSKSELIDFFKKEGILVFDLYPLPLPTFIYDNVKFDCTNSQYKMALEKYYEKLDLLITKETIIVQRYSKLYSAKKKRCEWTIFMQKIGRQVRDFETIAGKGMQANEEKIKTIFL